MAASTRSSGSTRTATKISAFPLPPEFPAANLNTATFDGDGVLWFTGQAGMYGRLDPDVGKVEAFAAPRGAGPYGIATTPDGEVWYASLAGSYLGRIDRATGEAGVVEPPTPGQGARRVWSDPDGRLFISEWNAGQVGMHDPADGSWREWRLPGDGQPQPYAVYVDDEGDRLAHRLRGQRHRPLRSRDRDVHLDPVAHPGRRGPPAARPPGRGVGRRVGDGQAGRRADLTAQPAADPGRTMPDS